MFELHPSGGRHSRDPRRSRHGWLTALATALTLATPTGAKAATFGPPMLDIAHQCSANSRRNATAMSECVVAESVARAEILQKWHKIPDARAETCVKLGRKNQKYPYAKIAECLAAAPPSPPAAAAPAAATRPAAPGRAGSAATPTKPAAKPR